MNAIDVVACLVVGVLALIGYRQGLIRGISALVSLAIGLLVALGASGWGASLLVEYTVIPPKYAPLVAFLSLFVFVALVVRLVAGSVQQAIHKSPLAPVDRFFGLCLGLVKGILIVLLLAGVTSLLPLSGDAERYVNRSLVITETRKMIPKFGAGVRRWLETISPAERETA
jgi:membrane protein required for colicin V production